MFFIIWFTLSQSFNKPSHFTHILATNSSVRATTTGFLRHTAHTTPTHSSHSEGVWRSGRDFVDNYTHSRATGPKTVHAERTLNFVRPEEYKASKKMLRQHTRGWSQRSQASSLTVTSIDFETKWVIISLCCKLFWEKTIVNLKHFFYWIIIFHTKWRMSKDIFRKALQRAIDCNS